MRAFLCICAAGFVASVSGCVSSQGYLMNRGGQTFYNRGNYAQAAIEFQRAVAANPYNADYVSNLAAAQRKQGNLPAAEQTWRQALNINPSHQPSYHGLAQMYVENNRQNDAVALLSSWTASQPYSAEPQIEMAWLHRELGNSAGAAQSLQQALSISPNHPKAQAALGQYYQDNGRMAEAANMYQQSLQSDWYQPEVQSRLATLKGFESPGMDQSTQFAQSFGGPTNVTMQFPPTPQFAQANRFPPAPQFARNSTYPMAGAQIAGVPQYGPTVHNHVATGSRVSVPHTAHMPMAGGFQVAQQPPAAGFAPTLPPQPAVTEYPMTGAETNMTYTGPVDGPFADQFISQPYAGAPAHVFPQTEPVNADPAHVPQVSAVPEVQPF